MSKISIMTTLFCLLAAGASVASADVHLVAISKVNAEISADRYRIKLRFTPDPEITVWSVLKEGQSAELGSFPLEGVARSRGGVQPERLVAPQFIRATEETRKDALVLSLFYGSLGQDQHHVVLQFEPTFFSYRLSVVKGRRRE